MGVLIFSHQRCGSTNLLKFMGEACGVPALVEPFNMKYLPETLPTWKEEPPERLAAHFSSVIDRARIVKHIYGQQKPEFDALVTKLPNIRLIIFLYRQNAEAAALSTLIARRIKAFHERPSDELGVITVEDIRAIAEEMRAKKAAALQQCREAGKPLVALSYEHLFPEFDFIRKRRVQALLATCRKHAKVDAVGRREFAQAYSKYLARDVKLNSDETYSLIENRAEIAASLPNIFEDGILARVTRALGSYPRWRWT